MTTVCKIFFGSLTSIKMKFFLLIISKFYTGTFSLIKNSHEKMNEVIENVI